MRKPIYYLIIFLISFFCYPQAKKDLSLEEIFSERKFKQDWVWGLNSMNNGKEYSIIDYEKESVSIDKYSYKSGKKIKTILNSLEIDSLNFDDYIFNSTENKILLKVESESIYRYSEKSFVYAYNLTTDSLIKIFEEKISLPDFSPNGKMISYVYNNNLYIYDITTNTSKACTKNGKKNKLIYGGTDWVYEEEFGLVKGYEWSDDSNYLAYYSFNESNVKEFSMDLFKQNLYPKQEKFKYPKAGEINSIVKIFILDIAAQKSIEVKTLKNDFEYIPRIYWTPDSKNLYILKLNRHQNHLQIISADPKIGSNKRIYEEKDDTYIDIHDNLIFLNNGFIWTSEKNGFNHIYKYSSNTKKWNKLLKEIGR